MDELRHVVKPKRSAIRHGINGSVAEIAESMRGEGARHGVSIDTRYGAGPAHHRGRKLRARTVSTATDHERDPGRRGRRAAASPPRPPAPAMGRDQVTTLARGSGEADRGHLSTNFVTPSPAVGIGLGFSKRIVEQC